jgi:hypothetical protein
VKTRHHLLVGLSLGLAACGSASTDLSNPHALDRPVDIAFGCYGGLRIVDDPANPTAADPVTLSAQPLASCSQRSYQKTRPLGQEDLDVEGAAAIAPVAYYAFILQSVPGTVALGTWTTAGFTDEGEQAFGVGSLSYQDADALTPGQNSIAVGELPIAIASDRAGCQMITANAGSCDLSVFDVTSVIDQDAATPPDVRWVPVVNAAGTPVLARPAAMIAEPAEDTQPIGAECPAVPEGLVYVAYPQCHLVAAIRAGTGAIEAGVLFNADGTVTVTDGNVSCPAECGEGDAATPGERPVTLDLVHDPRSGSRRMVIGADDSATLTVVELGADYLPLSVDRTVTFEGDLGLIDVSLSPEIGMGGGGGFDDSGDGGGIHQFVYAVADDATIRVADIIGPTFRECDTQADPRFLRGLNDPNILACMPLDPTKRRVLARGPGIELEAKSVPTAVAIVQSAWNNDMLHPFVAVPDSPDPNTLIGYFAFVTTTSGGTVVINIDDDVYRDFWDPTDPTGSLLPLAVAHQIRDSISGRDLRPVNTAGDRVCADEPVDGAGGPHVAGDGVTIQSDGEFINNLKTYTLPSLRRLECEGVDSFSTSPNAVDVPIYELGFAVPDAQRDLSFPDLRAVRDERWTLTWEGLLSLDSATDDVDGPLTRSGVIERSGSSTTLLDSSHPFCAMGAEPYDIAELVGCDPDQGDAQCGIGLTCYVHPDSVVGVGSCLPIDQADALASKCRDFLVSERRYTIKSTASGEVTLVPRRHVLETTPVDGCISDAQCQTLADYREYLLTDKHPFEDTSASTQTFRCEADPTRATSVDQCVETCEDSTDCDAGAVCAEGRCLESVAPPEECVPGVQRYRVRAGEAITVVGASTGYLHPIIEDVDGTCIKDPTASPLLVGRMPLMPPPCPGPDAYDVLAPNPCSETVSHTEFVPDYVPGSDTCEIRSDAGTLITRDAPAIRFKNPVMTFDLVDPYYGGDAMCREDRAGTLGLIPTVHHGYQTLISVESGFGSKRLGASAVLPTNVIRGPENSVWVVDEGDTVPQSQGDASLRGQVFRVETWNLGIINAIQ